MHRDRYVVNVEGVIVKDGRFLMVVRGNAETHAPGTLSVPGGKVEESGVASQILEATLRREIMEEVGIEVDDDLVYLESNAFVSDDGDPIVDVVFLCRHNDGKPKVVDPGEVKELRWMTAEEIDAHPLTPPWTRQSIRMAEERRGALGW